MRYAGTCGCECVSFTIAEYGGELGLITDVCITYNAIDVECLDNYLRMCTCVRVVLCKCEDRLIVLYVYTFMCVYMCIYSCVLVGVSGVVLNYSFALLCFMDFLRAPAYKNDTKHLSECTRHITTRLYNILYKYQGMYVIVYVYIIFHF